MILLGAAICYIPFTTLIYVNFINRSDKTILCQRPMRKYIFRESRGIKRHTHAIPVLMETFMR